MTKRAGLCNTPCNTTTSIQGLVLRKIRTLYAESATPELIALIEIGYIVKDQHGTERLRTTDQKAADAYDKALEIAERPAQWLREDQVL